MSNSTLTQQFGKQLANKDLLASPVFLVGAERSGTTLLRLMLDHHPRIAFQKEFEFAVDQLSEKGRWPDVEKYHRWLETNGMFQISDFQVDKSLTYPDLMNSFLIQKIKGKPVGVVGATIHRHFNRLLRVWPRARFIYLVRDGRDVASSCVKMGWAGNVWKGVERWRETTQLWQQLKTQISADQYHELKFEDLIQNREKSLQKICDFLKVSYNSRMLSYPDSSTYGAPDISAVSQWKKKMLDQDVRLVESRIGNSLELLGYQLSNLPPLRVNVFQCGYLHFQDRWNRIRFRLKRYGLDLMLKGALFRRLGLNGQYRQAVIQMNIIDKRYFK